MSMFSCFSERPSGLPCGVSFPNCECKVIAKIWTVQIFVKKKLQKKLLYLYILLIIREKGRNKKINKIGAWSAGWRLGDGIAENSIKLKGRWGWWRRGGRGAGEGGAGGGGCFRGGGGGGRLLGLWLWRRGWIGGRHRRRRLLLFGWGGLFEGRLCRRGLRWQCWSLRRRGLLRSIR